jgi:Flp pilus assembly protein TadB
VAHGPHDQERPVSALIAPPPGPPVIGPDPVAADVPDHTVTGTVTVAEHATDRPVTLSATAATGPPDWAVIGIVVALSLLAAALLLGGRVVRARQRIRLRRRLPTSRSDRAATRPRLAVVGWVDGVAAACGGPLRRLARRRADRCADRRLGRALLAGVLAAPLAGWMGAAVAGALVAGVPVVRARSARRRRSAAVLDGLPEVIDLLRVGVDAGLDVGTALALVADHLPPGSDVAGSLDRSRQRVRRGDRLTDALVEIEVLGEPARALHAALVATVRHGVPLGPALERAGDDARDIRRRRREESARTLPVKLLFPLVLCTLPALVLLTVVPLLVRSFPSLTP